VNTLAEPKRRRRTAANPTVSALNRPARNPRMGGSIEEGSGGEFQRDIAPMFSVSIGLECHGPDAKP